MKTNKKQAMLLIIGGTVLLAALVVLMLLQAGLLNEPTNRKDPVLVIQEITINELTNTPEPETGWWDKQPTPISLN